MSNILVNRRANFEYERIDEFDAGVVLNGSEVKSIRNGSVNIIDSFVLVKNNEVWLKNFKVSRYHQSHPSELHDDNRDKKLLLTKKQIDRISRSLENKGITCILLSIFTYKNRIKIKIATARGKKLWDKKESIKERDIARETREIL